MINIREVEETNAMIEKENLDVRTITLGISLMDCITSDLDKCADAITYIRKGKMEFSGRMEDYLRQCKEQGIGSNLEEIMIHFEKEALHEKFNA